MAEEPKFESFSVGVKPETNQLRRELMDAVAILGGRQNHDEPPRYHNHTFCMERLMFGLHSIMLDAPESFATIFGVGEPRYTKNFMVWLEARAQHGERGA